MKHPFPEILSAAATGIVFAAVATGCTMQPRYTRPDAPILPAWPQEAAYRPGAEESSSAQRPPAAAADIAWQEFFTDPTLRSLIERSLNNNRDLRVAALNVQAAAAQYRISRASLLPTVDAQMAELAQRTPAALTVPGEPQVLRQYSVNAGITNYELDLFGRIRSLNRQALESYLSLDETRRSAQISLVAAVANGYLTLLADQKLLAISGNTLAARSDSLALTQQLLEHGRSTDLDRSQAESSTESARADVERYTRLVAQDRNALRVLVGTQLPDWDPEEDALSQTHFLEEVPEGLPSDLMARRPDILAAEHDLLASNANIGAARAAFFPRITLTGSLGTSSTQLSDLFDAGTKAWSFAPQVSLPIFAGGANRANLNLAHVQKRIEIAQYEKSIQVAFREVADALAARHTLERQVASERIVVQANERTLKLSDMRFRAGTDTYLTVLDSQRQLFLAQQALTSDRLAQLQNMVVLYKALGGGWKSDGTLARRD